MNTADLSSILNAQSNSLGALEISGAGNASGMLSAGGVPVAWDFDLLNGSGQTINWTVTFTLLTSGSSYTTSASGSAAASASPGTLVKGTGSITIPTVTANIIGYNIVLEATDGNNGTYGVDIPGAGTLDLNPAPEPSTLLLMIPGAGALLLLRRKKRS
jgi:hypothetical protein